MLCCRFEQFGQPQGLGFTTPGELGLVAKPVVGVYKIVHPGNARGVPTANAQQAAGVYKRTRPTRHSTTPNDDDDRYAACTDGGGPAPPTAAPKQRGLPEYMAMGVAGVSLAGEHGGSYASLESSTDRPGNTPRWDCLYLLRLSCVRVATGVVAVSCPMPQI